MVSVSNEPMPSLLKVKQVYKTVFIHENPKNIDLLLNMIEHMIGGFIKTHQLEYQFILY